MGDETAQEPSALLLEVEQLGIEHWRRAAPDEKLEYMLPSCASPRASIRAS